MTQRTKVLYVQHAGALGGSCMSLLFTIKALDPARFRPVVALARNSTAVRELYESAGIETLYWPGIRTFEHTTLAWYPLHSPSGFWRLARQCTAWRGSERATTALLREMKPDLVHLNSVVLAPSAIATRREGLPLVWHVREPAADGHFGARRWFLGRLLERVPDEAIFISEFDRDSWVGGRRGIVVNNFVDFREFDRGMDRAAARERLGLPRDAPLVLFLGGLSPTKGFRVLLEAIPLVLKAVPNARFVLPASAILPATRPLARAARRLLPLVGLGTRGQRLIREIDRRRLSDALLMLPFTHEVNAHLAACDVLVFPSTVPHFARPIVEAGAMCRPVIGSRLGGVVELVEEGVTGLLVPPREPRPLADAIASVLGDDALARRLGEGGYAQARRRFDAAANIRAIAAMYETLLRGKPS